MTAHDRFVYGAGWDAGALDTLVNYVLPGIGAGTGFQPGPGRDTGIDGNGEDGGEDGSRYSAELSYEPGEDHSFGPVDPGYKDRKEEGLNFFGDRLSHVNIDPSEEYNPRVGTVDVPGVDVDIERYLENDYSLSVTDEQGSAEDVTDAVNRIDLTVVRADDWTEIDDTVVPTSIADEQVHRYVPELDLDTIEWGDRAIYSGFDDLTFDEPGAYFVKADVYEAANPDPIATDGFENVETLDPYTGMDTAREIVRAYDSLMGGKPGTFDSLFVRAPEKTKKEWMQDESYRSPTRAIGRFREEDPEYRQSTLGHFTGGLLKDGVQNLWKKMKQADQRARASA